MCEIQIGASKECVGEVVNTVFPSTISLGALQFWNEPKVFRLVISPDIFSLWASSR